MHQEICDEVFLFVVKVVALGRLMLLVLVLMPQFLQKMLHIVMDPLLIQ
jgi:hypothetical protein